MFLKIIHSHKTRLFDLTIVIRYCFDFVHQVKGCVLILYVVSKTINLLHLCSALGKVGEL